MFFNSLNYIVGNYFNNVSFIRSLIQETIINLHGCKSFILFNMIIWHVHYFLKSLDASDFVSVYRESSSLSHQSLTLVSFDAKGAWIEVRPHLTFNDDVLIVDDIPRKVIFWQDRLSFMHSSITSEPPLFTTSGSAVEVFRLLLKAQSLPDQKCSASWPFYRVSCPLGF